MLIHRMATDAAARRAVRVLALLLVAIATPRAAVASDATDLYYPEDGPVRALADADFDALVAENGREAWVVAFHADGCVSCVSSTHFQISTQFSATKELNADAR